MAQQQLSLFAKHEVEAIDTARVFNDVDEMQLRAPALFAKSAHPKMSGRYSFTNTYDILLHIHNRGFKVSSVQGGQKTYNKVMIRMRHDAYDKRDDAPEIVIVDSHDGTSRLKMMLGIIRFICMNGMVAGDMLYSRSFVHLAPDLMEQVMLELDDIQQHITALEKRVQRMKNYTTNIGERILLADAAIKARFSRDEDRPASFIADMRQRMLHTRRSDDESKDMYTVMNVIQENVLRGGMTYHISNTIRRVAPITNVDRNLLINHTLWREAEGLIAKAA